jgi:hypothetical protein
MRWVEECKAEGDLLKRTSQQRLTLSSSPSHTDFLVASLDSALNWRAIKTHHLMHLFEGN